MKTTLKISIATLTFAASLAAEQPKLEDLKIELSDKSGVTKKFTLKGELFSKIPGSASSNFKSKAFDFSGKKSDYTSTCDSLSKSLKPQDNPVDLAIAYVMGLDVAGEFAPQKEHKEAIKSYNDLVKNNRLKMLAVRAHFMEKKEDKTIHHIYLATGISFKTSEQSSSIALYPIRISIEKTETAIAITAINDTRKRILDGSASEEIKNLDWAMSTALTSDCKMKINK